MPVDNMLIAFFVFASSTAEIHYWNFQMFLSLTFATLLRVVVLPAVLSATIADVPERRSTDPKIITVGGIEIHTAIVPIATPGAFPAPGSNATTHSPSGTSLSKRVTNNACWYGCPTTVCTNGLSTITTPPTSADCTALKNAVDALAASELGPYPCSFNNSACPNFSVPPGYEQQYYYNTCLVGFANLNPPGGPTLSYCDYLVGGSMPTLYSNCVTTAGKTGGYCYDTSTDYLYAIEVRHS